MGAADGKNVVIPARRNMQRAAEDNAGHKLRVAAYCRVPSDAEALKPWLAVFRSIC